MQKGLFKIERTFHAPLSRVWKAITNKEQMKEWYFDIADFKPELGCQFSFVGGTEEHSYVHLCKIVELVDQKKLKYSWEFEGIDGLSFVTFELFPEGEKTKLILTHEGLHTFPKENPDLAQKNFEEGWTTIIGTHLKKFLEKVSS